MNGRTDECEEELIQKSSVSSVCVYVEQQLKMSHSTMYPSEERGKAT